MLCVIEVLCDVHNLLYEHIQDQVSSALVLLYNMHISKLYITIK